MAGGDHSIEWMQGAVIRGWCMDGAGWICLFLQIPKGWDLGWVLGLVEIVSACVVGGGGGCGQLFLGGGRFLGACCRAGGSIPRVAGRKRRRTSIPKFCRRFTFLRFGVLWLL